MQLGLGTVQFGFDYGLGADTRIVPEAEVRHILNVAYASGVDILDTARAYGCSEEALGRCMTSDKTFRVVTKTAPLKGLRGTAEAAARVHAGFLESLAALNTPAVYGLLVHHADDLLAPGGDDLWRLLTDLQASGLVKRIGVSVYTGEQIDELLPRYGPQIVQLPINVFDQRLIRGGQLAQLKHTGAEVHARSLFLQGLLLLDEKDVPPFFDPVRPLLRRWEQAAGTTSAGKAGAALAFARSLGLLDAAIIGVHSASEFAANADEYASFDAGLIDFTSFAIDDATILNPANWTL